MATYKYKIAGAIPEKQFTLLRKNGKIEQCQESIDWEQKIWADRPKVNASYEESDAHGLQGYFTINPKRLIDLMNKVDYTKNEVHEIFKMLSSI